MGIDRIGKSGGVPPQTPEVDPKGTVERPFQVDRPEAVAKTSGVDATAPLERLRAGTIDVNQYVDLKVDQAVEALKGLPASQLDDIKRVLREQMVSDPELVDLVRQATGRVPDEE